MKTYGSTQLLNYPAIKSHWLLVVLSTAIGSKIVSHFSQQKIAISDGLINLMWCDALSRHGTHHSWQWRDVRCEVRLEEKRNP
jgi:hypothetical protein